VRHTAAVTHAAAARTAKWSGGTWKSSDRIARPACHAPIKPNTVPAISRRRCTSLRAGLRPGLESAPNVRDEPRLAAESIGAVGSIAVLGGAIRLYAIDLPINPIARTQRREPR
jgi:hypothetical protein